MSDSIQIATALLRRDDFEGLRLAPYLCPAGYWTIGYGSRTLVDGSAVTGSTEPISQSEAIALLTRTVSGLRQVLRRAVAVPLTPRQEGALLSWQYNVGSAAMRGSTLIRLLNQRNYNAAASQLLRWDKATVNGRLVVLPGLQKRRRIEQAVFKGQPVSGLSFSV